MSITARFNRPARLLHWTMAVMILAMLLIGVAMVTSVAHYHALVALHRPLGLGILVLALLRLANRWRYPPPELPSDLPAWQRRAAHASHLLLYGLMLGLPLVGIDVLAVALVKLGQQDRARKAVGELLDIEPQLTISGFFARIPVPLERMARTYAQALKVAGLPE